MDKRKKRVIRTGRSLSWAEREEMILEYLKGNLNKQEIWYKYTGQAKEHGKILVWMRKLGYISDSKHPQVSKAKPTKTVIKQEQELSNIDLL
jgi:hypothetical protein